MATTADLSYRLLRSQHRVAVLEAELEAVAAGGELSTQIGGLFALESAVVLGDDLEVTIRPTQRDDNGLCDAGAAHVFHVALHAAAGERQAFQAQNAGLVVGCPNAAAPLRARLPGLTPGLAHGDVHACAIVELFNTDIAHLYSSNASTCSRFSHPVGVRLERGCVNVTRAEGARTRRPQGHCEYAAPSAPGFWLRGTWWPAHCEMRKLRPSPAPRPRLEWLHVIGDSVTYNLMDALRSAWSHYGGWSWGAVRRTSAGAGHDGPPTWTVVCDSGHCVSFRSYFDQSKFPSAVPSPPADLVAWIANSTQARTPLAPCGRLATPRRSRRVSLPPLAAASPVRQSVAGVGRWRRPSPRSRTCRSARMTS